MLARHSFYSHIKKNIKRGLNYFDNFFLFFDDYLYKILIEDYIKNDERLSEKNKELNPLEWTKLMNNYKNTAEEIILKEYIFI